MPADARVSATNTSLPVALFLPQGAHIASSTAAASICFPRCYLGLGGKRRPEYPRKNIQVFFQSRASWDSCLEVPRRGGGGFYSVGCVEINCTPHPISLDLILTVRARPIPRRFLIRSAGGVASAFMNGLGSLIGWARMKGCPNNNSPKTGLAA